MILVSDLCLYLSQTPYPTCSGEVQYRRQYYVELQVTPFNVLQPVSVNCICFGYCYRYEGFFVFLSILDVFPFSKFGSYSVISKEGFSFTLESVSLLLADEAVLEFPKRTYIFLHIPFSCIITHDSSFTTLDLL